MGNSFLTLANRAVISVSGSDAASFLQNLITCDVDNLKDGDLTFGGLLTPQGKVLFDFFVWQRASGYLLDVAEEFSADLAKRLTLYRLRADVAIERNEELAVQVSISGETDSTAKVDPRVDTLGTRRLVPVHQNGNAQDETQWLNHRIGQGVPELGHDFQSGDCFPHDVLMDQFGASGLDFTKGCFVGQEVVSRMKHRGTARNRFVAVKSDRPLPEAGTEISVDDRSIGRMGSVAGTIGLALVRTDRVAKAIASRTPIVADAAVLTITVPAFATFELA